MKILFFTNEYSHPKLPSNGGVGTFFKIMSEELTIRGHEVYVYGFLKKPIQFEDGGIKFSFFKKFSKQFPLKELMRSISSKLNLKNSELYYLKKERQFFSVQLKSYCKENHIDIIESFVFNGITAYWDNSTPLVLRFHGSRGFWHFYLGAKKEEHKIQMEQRALENTIYTINVSRFCAEAVKKIYNVETDKIIYNGIDTTFFSPEALAEPKGKSIFYFGTLSKAKGVDTLCKVFNEVVKKFPEASLHLIGRGEYYWDYLKRSILSDEAIENVTHHGPKQLADLATLLQKAAVCVVPSLNETFGLTVIEAMALEIPVIASDIPSFNEIIDHQHNGFIAKNKNDYLNYISFLFENNEEAKRIGRNARIKVVSNFNIQKMIEDSLRYYFHILENSN